MKQFDQTFANAYRETVQYEEHTFPISARYNNSVGKGLPLRTLQAHWHDDFEGVEYVQGICEYTVNGERFVMHPGDFILLKGNALHSIRVLKETESKVLLIHPRLFNQNEFYMQRYLRMLDHSEKAAWLIHANLPWYQAFADAFRRTWTACRERAAGYEITATGQAYQMLECLIRDLEVSGGSSARSSFSSSSIEALKRMIGFIHDEFRSEISVLDIADAANISKSSCDKMFRRVLSQSPIEYLTDYRINQSISLLSDGATITEAALSCGFGTLPYYSRVFKDKTGSTPSAYRKMLQAEM